MFSTRPLTLRMSVVPEIPWQLKAYNTSGIVLEYLRIGQRFESFVEVI